MANAHDVEMKKLELQQQQSKNLEMIVKELTPVVKEYFTTKMERYEIPKFRLSTYLFGGLLFVIVLATGVLVYYGKVTSDNFTFLIGVIIGYVMTHLKSIIQLDEE